MSSVETEALLAQLNVVGAEHLLVAPNVIHKKDMSVKKASSDFDTLWDDPHHVKFPCSGKNTYRLRSDPDNYLSKWKLICESLSAEIRTSKDLVDCILSYSPTFINQWTFDSLHELCSSMSTESAEKFWNTTLPYMAKLAKSLTEAFSEPLPLLRSGIIAELTLSQEQCAVLIANMFFCTFPQRSCNSAHGGNGTGAFENYPNVNFNTLFATNEKNRPNRRVQKLQCIIHYFETLAEKGVPNGKISIRRMAYQDEPSIDLGSDPNGLEEDKRQAATSGLPAPQWSLSTASLIRPTILTNGTIEDDGLECWQVDFANMVIGGGVIGAGCVQEEIRFVINPECLVSRLLCERLSSNESVLIIGPQRYSNYSGYRDSFAWQSHHEDATHRDSSGRIRTIITAIDAISFPPMHAYRQFSKNYILRELNKAYIGFLPTEEDESKSWPIATGHWGCGAFNGDKHLKAVLQWIAASELNRSLKYFAFGDANFTSHFERVVRTVLDSSLRVGDLLQIALDFKPGPNRNLFDYVLHRVGKSRVSM
jgi:poly(ADP-ribose) glycohydrolase